MSEPTENELREAIAQEIEADADAGHPGWIAYPRAHAAELIRNGIR